LFAVLGPTPVILIIVAVMTLAAGYLATRRAEPPAMGPLVALGQHGLHYGEGCADPNADGTLVADNS
jgi:hypothetical protein